MKAGETVGLFSKNKTSTTALVQTARHTDKTFSLSGSYPLSYVDGRLYDALRANVPVIDAAIMKTMRLVGGFEVKCSDSSARLKLDNFMKNVKVGLSSKGINAFIDSYLESLLTYGNAAGEILTTKGTGDIIGLSNADVTLLSVKEGKNPVDRQFWVNGEHGPQKVKRPQLILFSALNPPASSPYGVSVLRGLPAISGILLRIYECIEQNFDRVGNVRYAVTYKPSGETDKAYAKERAKQIASEWSKGMADLKDGHIRDFVAVGDVDIKVIGADNQIIDTQVPVRQLLEQIIAKLSIPPFMLGISWSTSERMSQQQADILTSELEYYRRILTPVIEQIALAYLVSIGKPCKVSVDWQVINMQDEVDSANARLNNAKAQQIEAELKGGKRND